MQGVLKDMTNMKYGRLFVESRADNRRKKIARWNCVCDCGAKVVVDGARLRNGNTKSCGCYKRERTSEIKATHGHCKNRKDSKTYTSWRGMVDRATNPNHKSASYYMLRGITVCDRWQSFENFLADMGERPEGMCIDRIDNNGNYEPGNCRWVSHRINCNNTSKARKIDFHGYKVSLSKLASLTDIPRRTLLRRLKKYGWDVKKAMLTPKYLDSKREQWVKT